MTSLPVAEADPRHALRLFLAVAGASVGLLATVVLLVSLVLSLVSAAQYTRQFVTSVLPRDRANSRSS